MNETMNAILERRSTRSYTARPVSEEDLKAILEAALWAPTARNEQEIKITVMTDPAERAAFRKDIVEKTGSARFENFDYGSPVFLFLYGDKDFPYTELDSGIVAENICLAAQSLGLGSLMIGCIRDFMRSEGGKPWRERIGMKENDLFTLGVCLGYIDKPTKKQARKEGRVTIL
jgi:nitroreductase